MLAIPENQVAVGLCYRTAEDQVRFVNRIEGDQVKYEARGGKFVPRPWEFFPPQSTAQFAFEVAEIVPEHWETQISQASDPRK